MEENQKTSEYFSKLIALVNQMSTCGKGITDQQVVEKVMRSLTSRFNFIVVAIQEYKNLKSMKIRDLQSSLEADELMVIIEGIERETQQELQAKVMQNDRVESNFKKKGKRGPTSPNWYNAAKKRSEEMVE